jgi:hypothetical protein
MSKTGSIGIDHVTEPSPAGRDEAPTLVIHGGRSLRFVRQLNMAQRFKRQFGLTLGELLERILRVGVLSGLLIAATATFVVALASLGGWELPNGFEVVVPTWLNAALLIFIVLELAQTVRQQIKAEDEERLSRSLVCNLVAIGVLSAVRHLLAVGARMTLDGDSIPWGDRRGEILELGVSAGIVLLLVIGWRLAGGVTTQRPTEGP